MKEFKDLNFKLAIIQELMYNQKVLKPKFEIEKFVDKYKERKIDIEEEGYDPIPEALGYFKNLDIPGDLLKKITKLNQDGGDEIYLEICPFWDGEDDVFNITSLEDLPLVPNLKSVVLFYDESNMVEKFKSKGIEAEYL